MRNVHRAADAVLQSLRRRAATGSAGVVADDRADALAFEDGP